MRDLLLVVALVAWLLVELLWPQVTSVKADTRDPEEVMLEGLGGSLVHGSANRSISGFFGVRRASSDALEDGNPLNLLTGSAGYARTFAFSVFDQTSRTGGQLVGRSQGGQPSAPAASSHPDRPDRRADSATSMIHH